MLALRGKALAAIVAETTFLIECGGSISSSARRTESSLVEQHNSLSEMLNQLRPLFAIIT